MDDVLDDPEELGRRISAVRGYLQMQRPEFAQLLGISVPTLRRWEDGEESALGRRVNVRREKADRVLNIDTIPIPGEIMGITVSPPQLEDRVAAIERKLFGEGSGRPRFFDSWLVTGPSDRARKVSLFARSAISPPASDLLG